MTRLVKELNTQATSLDQEVKQLTEDINEFARQSIPVLLATLIAGQMFLLPC